MEMKNILVALIIGFILFELIEHIVIPVIFYLIRRRKLSATDVDSLVGEVVRVRQWKGQEGQVFMKGELWKAVCEVPFKQGDKAFVTNVKGLTLTVKPIADRDTLQTDTQQP